MPTLVGFSLILLKSKTINFWSLSGIFITIALLLAILPLYIITFIVLTNLAYNTLLASFVFVSITICTGIYTWVKFVSPKQLVVNENCIYIRHYLMRINWSKNISLKNKTYLKACNFLTKPERVWLEWEINSFLRKK